LDPHDRRPSHGIAGASTTVHSFRPSRGLQALRRWKKSGNAATGTPPTRAEQHRNTCGPMVAITCLDMSGINAEMLANVTRNRWLSRYVRMLNTAAPGRARYQPSGRAALREKYCIGFRPHDPRHCLNADQRKGNRQLAFRP
jgi:hypothetical protein